MSARILLAAAAAIVSGWAAAAEPPPGIRLPETEYQAARQVAAERYAAALSACGFVNWSSRLACEAAAMDDLQRAEGEARRAYLKVQSDIAGEAARRTQKPPPK